MRQVVSQGAEEQGLSAAELIACPTRVLRWGPPPCLLGAESGDGRALWRVHLAIEGPGRRPRAMRLSASWENQPVGETVRLTVVPDEGAAEALVGLLRSEGIECFYRDTDVSAAGIFGGSTFAGWREVLVDEEDLERASQAPPRRTAIGTGRRRAGFARPLRKDQGRGGSATRLGRAPR